MPSPKFNLGDVAAVLLLAGIVYLTASTLCGRVI